MTYTTLTSDPLVMAIVSALIGTFIAYYGTRLYDFINQRKEREQGLQNLSTLLETHKSRFNEIVSRKGINQVHPHINVQSIYNFIHSSWIDQNKDSELLNLIYLHIENIEQISRVFNIMDIRTGGFTQLQRIEGDNIEQNLVDVIPTMLDNLNKCIKTINV